MLKLVSKYISMNKKKKIWRGNCHSSPWIIMSLSRIYCEISVNIVLLLWKKKIPWDADHTKHIFSKSDMNGRRAAMWSKDSFHLYLIWRKYGRLILPEISFNNTFIFIFWKSFNNTCLTIISNNDIFLSY